MTTPRPLPALLGALAGVLGAAACAPARAPSAPAPAVAAETPPALPPVPLVEGPLAIRVQYPPDGAAIAARDSNFILGTVGNGRATLVVDGARVPVLPNGSFLAWLPVPRSGSAGYEMVASVGADTVRRVHRVRVPGPRPVIAETGALVVDSGSVTPAGFQALRADESVRVSVRAPRNATVRAELADGSSIALLNADGATLWATDVAADRLRRPARIVVHRGADTVRLRVAAVADADTSPSYAALGVAGDTTRLVIARPIPGGTYKWFFLPGTVARVTGSVGASARVRLDSGLEVWVDSTELRRLPTGTPEPRRVAGNARVIPETDRADVIIPIAERPPFLVEQIGPRELAVTMYGVRANTDIINYARNDSLVRFVTWEQVTADRARYVVHLSQPVFGWEPAWQPGAFVLRVRRPPAVDAERPLRNIAIAVDAGHPPAGATGPSGLYEGVAVLGVAEELKRLLEARGARVVMTRTTNEPMELHERPRIARRAGAHAFVSLHLDAVPDGVNPITASGSGTYFFNPPSEPLAREIQRGMVARMGQRDRGVYTNNFAVIRPSWMPAVLAEGAFIILPELEAALRTPEFRARYARGVADGLEAFFRTLARALAEPR